MNHIATSFFVCAGTYVSAWFFSMLFPDLTHLWYYFAGMAYMMFIAALTGAEGVRVEGTVMQRTGD